MAVDRRHCARRGTARGRPQEVLIPGPRAADLILGGGLALHLLIMCAMAAVYWLACRRWPAIVERPVPAGIAYGLLTWAAMNHVVVPLSRAAAPPFIPAWFVDGLLAHVLLVGLLFAFVARWSARRAKTYP